MQNRRNQVFALLLVLLVQLGIGFVYAATARVIGFFGEIRGNAYWQNDGRKTPVKNLEELKENSKLVLLKGSKLEVLYLESGQQYELNGPGLVQFTNNRPVALNGAPPKKIGAAASVTENKIHVDNKNVQTAGKTLVSTEKKTGPDSPAMASAPAPPPPPPPGGAYTPYSPIITAPVTDVAASASAPTSQVEYDASQQAAQAYVAREAEMAAARQAESQVAAARRAEEEAAARARQTAEADAAAKKDPGCQPVESDPEKDGQTSESSTKTVDGKSLDCPMITF